MAAISVSIPDTTRDRIKNRAGEDQGFSGQIQDDLALCWGLLDRGLAQARKKLTRAEAKLLLDVQNGTFFDASQLSMWIGGGLAHQVSDGIDLDGLDKKWELDGPSMLDKISALTDLETVAILDWLRWMWRNHEQNGLWDSEFAKFRG